MREKSYQIKKYILDNILEHPKDIISLTTKEFVLTRQAAQKHLQKLITEGQIQKKGNTRNIKYTVKQIVDFYKKLPIEGLKEDIVWREYIKLYLKDLPKNVLNICQYGFTEILNNAIEHSEGNFVYIELKSYFSHIMFSVLDDGIGIFNKIQNKFNYHDPLQTILELSKGKLTTDNENHPGEGLFFALRMFDNFEIHSGNLCLKHSETEKTWLIDDDLDLINGTTVKFRINMNSTRTYQQVLDEYTSVGTHGFTKTSIPVTLARFGEENLISRSQAKRLLDCIGGFKNVIFDFKGVDSIGQGFTDEIFRVYKNKNTKINISHINTTSEVLKMITRSINLNC